MGNMVKFIWKAKTHLSQLYYQIIFVVFIIFLSYKEFEDKAIEEFEEEQD